MPSAQPICTTTVNDLSASVVAVGAPAGATISAADSTVHTLAGAAVGATVGAAAHTTVGEAVNATVDAAFSVTVVLSVQGLVGIVAPRVGPYTLAPVLKVPVGSHHAFGTSLVQDVYRLFGKYLFEPVLSVSACTDLSVCFPESVPRLTCPGGHIHSTLHPCNSMGTSSMPPAPSDSAQGAGPRCSRFLFLLALSAPWTSVSSAFCPVRAPLLSYFISVRTLLSRSAR